MARPREKAPNQKLGLTTLPHDLLLLLFRYLPSFSALNALLRTARVFVEVYNAHQNVILPDLARRLFPKEAFTLLDLFRPGPSGIHQCARDFFAEICQGSFSNYGRERISPDVNTIGRAECAWLLRDGEYVKGWVEELVRERMDSNMELVEASHSFGKMHRSVMMGFFKRPTKEEEDRLTGAIYRLAIAGTQWHNQYVADSKSKFEGKQRPDREIFIHYPSLIYDYSYLNQLPFKELMQTATVASHLKQCWDLAHYIMAWGDELTEEGKGVAALRWYVEKLLSGSGTSAASVDALELVECALTAGLWENSEGILDQLEGFKREELDKSCIEWKTVRTIDVDGYLTTKKVLVLTKEGQADISMDEHLFNEPWVTDSDGMSDLLYWEQNQLGDDDDDDDSDDFDDEDESDDSGSSYDSSHAFHLHHHHVHDDVDSDGEDSDDDSDEDSDDSDDSDPDDSDDSDPDDDGSEIGSGSDEDEEGSSGDEMLLD